MRWIRRFLEDGSMWRNAPLNIGVAGNHMADEVLFAVPSAYMGFTLFLKIDGERPNKLLLTQTTDGFLWTVRRGQIADTGGVVCQLQAEKQDGSEVIVWQSKPFTAYAAKQVEADTAMANEPTPYLQELDLRVAANADRAEAAANRAEQSSGSGGTIGNVDIADVDGLQAAQDAKANVGTVSAHVSDIENPHSVTLAQIGAAASEHNHETEDVNGLQTALDNKANASALAGHIGDAQNPHQVTAAQTGAAPMAHTHAASEVEGLTEQLTELQRLSTVVDGWIGDSGMSISADAFSIDVATGELLCSADVPISLVINAETGMLMQLGEQTGIAFQMTDGVLEVTTNAE